MLRRGGEAQGASGETRPRARRPPRRVSPRRVGTPPDLGWRSGETLCLPEGPPPVARPSDRSRRGARPARGSVAGRLGRTVRLGLAGRQPWRNEGGGALAFPPRASGGEPAGRRSRAPRCAENRGGTLRWRVTGARRSVTIGRAGRVARVGQTVFQNCSSYKRDGGGPAPLPLGGQRVAVPLVVRLSLSVPLRPGAASPMGDGGVPSYLPLGGEGGVSACPW